MLLFRSNIVLLTLFTYFSSSVIAAEKTIELFTVHYPPYTIIDAQENISGIDVEVTRAAFAAVGIDVNMSVAPWKRIEKNIKHGRITGTITCSKRASRAEFIVYSDQLSEAHQVAVVAANASTRKIKNLADLNKFQVTVVEGWGVERELTTANIEHATTPDIDSGIRSVIYRDIDVFYNGELASLYHARQLDLQNKIKTHRFADKESTPFYLCLSKIYPGNVQLLEQFNMGLQAIQASGEFDKIYKKYL